MKISNFTKRAVAFAVTLLMVFTLFVPFSKSVTAAAPSLAQTFESDFLVGTIWHSNWQHPRAGDAATLNFIRGQFNAITAEDYMKVDQLLGAGRDAWSWNWTRADRVVNWAAENDFAMIGHALVWHSQSRAWLTSDAQNRPLTREQAIANMERYINTVAGRYRGRMYSWDVVNEAITGSVGSFSGDWRNHLRRTTAQLDGSHTQWYNAFANGAAGAECGSDYIFYAFRFARLADPYAILYYNDFNEEQPGKRDAIAQMVTQINERWRSDPAYDGRLLIEVIGMQSHYHAYGPWATNFGNVRRAMDAFVATGARISITELDITVGGGWPGGPPNQPRATSAELPGRFETQAAIYARLFGYYLEFAEHINRVTFWGFTDGHGWRRAGYPLIFDANLNPKPAFHSIIATASGRIQPPPEPTPPEPTPPEPTPPEPTPPEPTPPTPGERVPGTHIMRFGIGHNVFMNRGVVETVDPAPFEHEGRAMVPFRVIAEALGGTASHDREANAVVFTRGDMTRTLRMGVPLPDNMGTPIAHENRAFVPVRYVANFFGVQVRRDSAARAVYLYY